jgi:uncharacterized protein (TIGR00369 family)
VENADRRLTIEWQDPAALARAARAMAGIDFLRAIQGGALPAPPIARLLGFDLEEVEPGRAVFAVAPGERHYNPIGVVHGGLAATLCDSAMGCAVQSLLPAGAGYTTLEFKVNFVRAVTRDTGKLLCEGSIVHLGRRSGVASARLTDAQGTLYAHATTTCLVFRPEGE